MEHPIVPDPLYPPRNAAGLAASAAAPLLAKATRAFAAPASEAQATALLDSIGQNLLRHNPEQATSLGIDTGARAPMRSALGDRSAAGRASLAATLKATSRGPRRSTPARSPSPRAPASKW